MTLYLTIILITWFCIIANFYLTDIAGSSFKGITLDQLIFQQAMQQQIHGRSYISVEKGKNGKLVTYINKPVKKVHLKARHTND